MFDARMVGNSGIGTQIQNVVQHLIHSPIPLELLGDPGLIQQYFPEFRGPITPFYSPIYSIAEQLKFPALKKGYILHSPHYNASLRHLKNSVVVVHDLIHLQSIEFAGPAYRAYATLFLTAVSRYARAIVTVSETTRRELIARFPAAEEKTTVVYNGINHSLFYPRSAKSISLFKTKYSLPARYFLVVGIGKRHKNMDFVIRSLAERWKSGELKIPLVIGGSAGRLPDYVAEVVESLQVSSLIHLAPMLPLEELPLLYSGAELFLMPSLLEGFGFPVIEAMACGVPVLSSTASSLPEIGSHSALYFDPYDSSSLLTAMDKVLYNEKKRKKIVENGLKRARFFDWKHHTTEMIRIYQSL